MTAEAVAAATVEGLDSSRARRLQQLAALLAVVAVGLVLGNLFLGSLGDPRYRVDPTLITFGFLSTVVTFPVMGALIVQRRPFTRVAWLMIALGICVGLGLLTYAYGVVGQPPRGLPLALAVLVASQLFFLPALVIATTWILLLYPVERLLSPAWRWVGVLSVVAGAMFEIGTLFRPGELDSTVLPGLRNPLGVEGPNGQIFQQLVDSTNPVGLAALGLGMLAIGMRYRQADQIVAAQIRWLALAAAVAIVALGLSIAETPFDDLFFGLGLTSIALMPIAIGLAITRYRLYDIDRLINRALVYGSLTAILAGVFTAGIGLAQRLFIAVTKETSDAAIVLTTLVVATLYAPLRKRLEAIVDRWFKYDEARFGRYRDELTKYLTLADPTRASQRLVEEAVSELGAVGGAVFDAGGHVVASAGLWPSEIRFRLPIGGDAGGSIAIGPRIDGRPHDDRAVAMLSEVASLAATAMAGGGAGAARR